jgi:hypothetical protein
VMVWGGGKTKLCIIRLMSFLVFNWRTRALFLVDNREKTEM